MLVAGPVSNPIPTGCEEFLPTHHPAETTYSLYSLLARGGHVHISGWWQLSWGHRGRWFLLHWLNQVNFVPPATPHPPTLTSATAVVGKPSLTAISRARYGISLFFWLRVFFKATEVHLVHSLATIRKNKEVNGLGVNLQTIGDGRPWINAPAPVFQIESSGGILYDSPRLQGLSFPVA